MLLLNRAIAAAIVRYCTWSAWLSGFLIDLLSTTNLTKIIIINKGRTLGEKIRAEKKQRKENERKWRIYDKCIYVERK